MKSRIRVDRYSEEIKATVAKLLATEIKDPRLQLVTITDAEMSPDLAQVRIFYSFLGEKDDFEQVERGFKSATGFVRTMISKSLHLKYTPKLEFIRDASIVRGSRIDELFQRLKDEEGI